MKKIEPAGLGVKLMPEYKYKRILAIGDIHGKYSAFMHLWSKVDFHCGEDCVIFLGDYIDRGHQSAAVMAWVLDRLGQEDVVFLRGNHEQMCLDACCTKSDYDPEEAAAESLWMDNGGDRTVSSLNDFGNPRLMQQWLSAVKGMPLFVEIEQDGQTYIFCHAGITPRIPMDKQDKETLLWERSFVASKYAGPAKVVVGHTPVQFARELGYDDEFRPLLLNGGHIIMVDTGSYLSNGFISCVDVLNDQVWQSNRF